MSPSAETALRQAKLQLEEEGQAQPSCSPEALAAIRESWPIEFGYPFPEEYSGLVRIVNGGLESEEFQLAYVPDPKSAVGQVRREARSEDVRELNRRMSDSYGAVMRRKRFFFGSGAEAYYALDLENREVVELDATLIDDEPVRSWKSLDDFIVSFI